MSTNIRLARWTASVVFALVAAAAGVSLKGGAPQQDVRFRASVDLVAVDTQVIDKDGQPIGSLTPDNFQVWVNGQPRKVVSADLVKYPLTNPRVLTPPLFETPEVLVPADLPPVTGRVMVIAIDEMSFTAQAMPQVMQTIRSFISKLPAEDVVAVFPYPFGPGRIDLTHFHSAAGLQLTRVPGLRAGLTRNDLNLSPSEAVDIFANDTSALKGAYERECLIPFRGPDQCIDRDDRQIYSGAPLSCAKRLKAYANEMVGYVESVSGESFSGLRDLMDSLKYLSGPKTLVLASAGIMASDRIGGRPDVQNMMSQAGKLAAAANATLYVLHFDGHMNEVFNGVGMDANPCQRNVVNSMTTEPRDAMLFGYGLMRIAGEAGGNYMRITAGTGELQLQRIMSETSAYYTLGVQPDPSDRDGRVHFIRVKSNVKGATLRARTQVTIPKPTNK